MVNGIIWKEIESKSAYNSGLAASATEQIIAGTDRVDNYNSLLVQNLDVVDSRINLGNATNVSGKVFIAAANGGIVNIRPEDGIWFQQVGQTNLSSATAQTANKILFRVSKAVRVG